jgi:hypothetical protein
VTPEVPTRDFIQTGRVKISQSKRGSSSTAKKADSNIHPPSQIRIQYSGELFAERELSPDGGERIAAATQTRKGKNEKNAFKHGVGSCGPIRMGAGLGDHHNDNHD